MTQNGAFTFVLHSHLPYARQAGMWPHGEEWIHEAIAETYVPFLNALYDLREAGVPFKITVEITPILAEQLADPLIIDHFIIYAAERAAWAGKDVSRFEEAGDQALSDLARFYHHWYARSLTSFQDRYGGNIIAAFKQLQDEGLVEIATSAATHGYLPLLSRDSSIYGQLQTGVDSYRRHFGRDPKAIWLPECAYRGAFEETENSHAVRRPGLESFLASLGLQVFFSETHTVEGGKPVGKAAGEAIGPYEAIITRRFIKTNPEEQNHPGTTFRPYWVGDEPGRVAVLGRNNRIGEQVWSGTYGYPGDFVYREFHRKDSVSGMQYWRIGGKQLDLGSKPLYEPSKAADQVKSHAAHFASLVTKLLAEYKQSSGKSGVISAAYDTELFGHWWFEGVDWIKEVLRLLAQDETVELTTATRMVETHLPDRVLDLPESSWGAGGGHDTWLNDETRWMWPMIHVAEMRMESIVAADASASSEFSRFLAQLSRELLLLQSSDWPFLITTGQAKAYATKRFHEHLARFDQLATIIERGGSLEEVDQSLLSDLESKDNPFPEIDFSNFGERQGSAAPVVKSQAN
jgi:1,4-alpha-glucan branching enzyme